MSHASIAHEAPLEVLRQAPEVVLALLHAFGFEFEAASVEAVDTDLTETTPSHRSADFVALIKGADGRAVAAVIVEVQLAADMEKAISWPRYITHVQARYGVATTLLVLTAHRRVARWIARLPRFSPSLVLTPSVIGPRELVRIAEESGAALTSPLAILAALADLAEAGTQRATPEEDASRWGVRVFEALAGTPATEEQFLRLNLLQGAAPARFHARLNEILEAASMDIRALIHNQGRVEGHVEGRLEGQVQGRADSILQVLAARGLEVDASAREKIAGERDLAMLERWMGRALTATVVDEVFR